MTQHNPVRAVLSAVANWLAPPVASPDLRTRQHGGTGAGFPEMPQVGPPGPASVSPPVGHLFSCRNGFDACTPACPNHQPEPQRDGGDWCPNCEPPEFTAAVHRATLREGRWSPACTGVGWFAPLAGDGHIDQVTCPDCLRLPDPNRPAAQNGGQADSVCGHVEVYVNHGNETVGPFRCTRPAGHPDAHSDGRVGWYGGSVNGGQADG